MEKHRKKDSARLVWDTKPRRAPNPKDIEFQTAEVVIPNPQNMGQLPVSFRDGLFGEEEIDKQKMNRLIWGDNLLAMQAQKLDGTGYKRLIILGWDYDYSYHQALESRINSLKDRLRVKIESRNIPTDIYDYLKKAKNEEDISALANKVHFHERPYLRMSEPNTTEQKDGKVQIEIAINRYVLMDIPVSHTSAKEQETYSALMKLSRDNFAVLIDYWAIDWDYDGYTFKSQWQAFRGNGKKAKTVPLTATETLEKKKRIIAVRV
ncbi:hypothetical protein KKH65_05520 [bacterium]|nr:hypothetical protein [bacterium]